MVATDKLRVGLKLIFAVACGAVPGRSSAACGLRFHAARTSVQSAPPTPPGHLLHCLPPHDSMRHGVRRRCFPSRIPYLPLGTAISPVRHTPSFPF